MTSPAILFAVKSKCRLRPDPTRGVERMRKTYRLAKIHPFHVQYFGPLMTLNEAMSYRAELAKGGFDVVVVNVESV